MNNKILIYFHGSDVILGSEDKRPNTITKDGPIALNAQGIPRILRAVIQEPWKKTKICIYCKSQYHTFLL